jgi:hypothetical protein
MEASGHYRRRWRHDRCQCQRDLIVVLAGFIAVAEILGLITAPTASSERLEEPPLGPEPEKPPLAERAPPDPRRP